MNETEKWSVLCFDETYVSSRICFDKKNERVIGPHKCIQTVIVRGIYYISILYHKYKINDYIIFLFLKYYTSYFYNRIS